MNLAVYMNDDTYPTTLIHSFVSKTNDFFIYLDKKLQALLVRKNLFGNTKVDETLSDKIIEKTKVLGEKKIRTKYFSGISSGK